MKVKKRKGMLVISLPLIDPPKESKSGKTLLVASSNGPRRTSINVDNKPVTVIVAAYVRPDGYVKRTRVPRKKKSLKSGQVTQRSRTGPIAQSKHSNR